MNFLLHDLLFFQQYRYWLHLHNFLYQHISKGLIGRMLSEINHTTGSSSKIPHRVFMSAAVPSMILSTHIYELDSTVQTLPSFFHKNVGCICSLLLNLKVNWIVLLHNIV